MSVLTVSGEYLKFSIKKNDFRVKYFYAFIVFLRLKSFKIKNKSMDIYQAVDFYCYHLFKMLVFASKREPRGFHYCMFIS